MFIIQGMPGRDADFQKWINHFVSGISIRTNCKAVDLPVVKAT